MHSYQQKPLLMLLVIPGTDLNSAHLSALTTSAALKNGISGSSNLPFIYQPQHLSLFCSAQHQCVGKLLLKFLTALSCC